MTENQTILDILMVVDAETLVQKYPGGTASEPISIPEPLMFLICDSAHVDFGQASKELKIAVKSLDEIRWRSASLSLNGAAFSLLYAFKLVNGDDIISPPIPLEAEVKVPLPDPDNPTTPKTQTIQSYFWSSTALAQGEATYTFYFMVLDRDGTPRGYYYWDPFIKITQ